MMRLLEFQKDQILLKDTISALGAHFKLERVGGDARVYIVGNELGVVYLVNSGPKAVGISWARGTKQVSRIFVWANFNAANPPDFEAAVPLGHGPAVMEVIVNLVTQPHRGIVENESPVADVEPKPVLMTKASTNKFEVPGVEITGRKIEQAFADQNDQPKTMEEQYEELSEKVKLVASNKSAYIKALLITGAASSGKSFTVMKTIKELGLQEGSDYVVIKGSITDAALYLTFIEQIDALTIFDDCDSVCETKDGKNMLKNALDTNAVRDIGRPTANSTNTKHMASEERQLFVDAISRIFRGEATSEDISRFDDIVPHKAKKEEAPKYDPTGDDDLTFEERYAKISKFFPDDAGPNETRLIELQNYFKRRPPNRIDFKGRIIFISNMDENEWDSAILTRTFRQNMNFADGEMLDFIERIKDSIAAPGLSQAQKDEVMAYIRERHSAGKIKSRVNFRLIQQCFDLRLCGPWQRMIAAL